MSPQGQDAQPVADTATRLKQREQLFVRLAGAVGIGLFLTYFVLGRWFPESPILGFGVEDGPVEWAGALLWLAASGVCAVRLLGGRGPRLLLALWMVLSFLFFGEEISWGQRLLGYSVPLVEEANYQGEFNLHNLSIFNHSLLNAQNLFRLGFLTYFLVIPLAMASSRLRSVAARVGYSAPDRAFLVMVWTVLATGVILRFLGSEAAVRITVETEESFYALTVLLYVVFYLRDDGRRSHQGVVTSSSA